MIAVFLCLAVLTPVVAQTFDYANPVPASRNLDPTAMLRRLNPIDTVQVVTTPPLDLAAIEQEDIKREMSGLAPRFAIPRDTFVSPLAGGTWELIDADTWVWRLRIQSPDARNLYLGFTRYVMPESGRLFVYSTDGTRVLRGFTHADNETHGQLWTPVLLTDDLTIEVTISADQRPQLELELTTIGQGYRGFGSDAPEKSGSCNIDVVCPEGVPWQNEIHSVAVIGLGTGTFCTGFMVNNTAQDRTPYFMTADHCGITIANASSLVAYWNYETSVCGGTPDGVLSDFNTGSIFRAGSSASDFTLVELDDDPDPSFEVTFGGWDRSTTATASAVGIHHPNTDEKRISFENDPTATTSYLGSSSPGDGTHLRIVDWDLGTTEPGSSGSPVFSPEHRVVGQLHGGFAACGNDDSDWYGRFSVSWTGGGTTSTRLSNWLDPGSTGAMTIDTLGLGMTVSPMDDVVHFGEAGGPFTPPSVMYTLTNSTGSALSYSVSLTNGIGLLLNGGTGPISDFLANGASTNITVSVGPAINGLPSGVYNEIVVFDDLTNGIVTSVNHDVEIDQTLVTVTPTTDLFDSGPVGGPFTQTMAYTVTSERPTPTTLRVSADRTWISINGGSGPVDIPLSGVGDNSLVTIGYAASANSLTAGFYTGTVTFDDLSTLSRGAGGAGAGDSTRTVTLDVGRFVLNSSDTPIPIPDSPGGPITSTISVIDDFCVGDVDVSVDITHTWSGDLTVELESPTGVVVVLHNQTGGSTPDVIETYDDDGGTLPDGPGALLDYELTGAMGIWTLRIQDHASFDTGVLNSWQLGIAQQSGGGPCPTPDVIADFPLDTDPGWAREGFWAFGDPLGASGDPPTGYTGLNVLGYNLNGNYFSSNGTTHYLTTDPVDLTGFQDTKLTFRRWLGILDGSGDHANIEISTDGVLWLPVWTHSGPAIIDTEWKLISYSIGSVADDQPSVRVRWGLGPTDASGTSFGWNLDDIMFTGFPMVDPCPADVDDSGAVTVVDLLALLGDWGPCDPPPASCPSDTNGDLTVNVVDLLNLLGTWGACPP